MWGRNRDADAENGRVDTGWEGEGGMNWECSTDIYTPPCVTQTASRRLLYGTRSSALYSEDREGGMGAGGREAQEKWNRCKLIADSLGCRAEANTTL